jgi:hypothetical protein
MAAPSPQQRLDLVLDLQVELEKLYRLVESLTVLGAVKGDGLRVDAEATSQATHRVGRRATRRFSSGPVLVQRPHRSVPWMPSTRKRGSTTPPSPNLRSNPSSPCPAPCRFWVP